MSSIEVAPRADGQHLTEDERDRAMLVLALNGSHAGRASRQLADEGLKVSERQLQNYRHWPRYQEIRKTQAAQIEQGLLEHYKDAARVNVQVGIESGHQTLEALENRDIKPADVPKVGQQAMVASGIALDKAMLIEGRPTTITQNQDLNSIVQRMEREMGFTVDSTANEIEDPDASLVRESALANPRELPAG